MTDEDIILYEIAFSLKMPLYKLLEEMPYEELLGWIKYFERRPLEWRDDLRTAYLMNAFGTKKSPQEIFPSLKAISGKSEGPVNSLKGSLLFHKMLSAKNGDSLAALKDFSEN